MKSEERITIVGLGKAGCMIVEECSRLIKHDWLHLMALDTDQKSIKLLEDNPRVEAECIDKPWRAGKGCGGDPNRGSGAISRYKKTLLSRLKDSSLIIMVGGLGGGFATGGLQTLAATLLRSDIPSICLATLPFMMEGQKRVLVAEAGSEELMRSAGVLLLLSNDLLFSELDGATGFKDAFVRANRELAKTLFGICEIMRHENILSVDYGDFHKLLNKEKANCRIGVGRAASDDGLDRGHIALKRVIESPFLGGEKELQDADVVIANICGGDDLSFGETKKIFNSIERLLEGSDAQLIIGSSVSEVYNNEIQVVVIAIHYEQDKVFRAGEGKVISAPKEEEFEQAELPGLTPVLMKGIFSNHSPTWYEGEDLDQPTYYRKSIIIDKG